MYIVQNTEKQPSMPPNSYSAFRLEQQSRRIILLVLNHIYIVQDTEKWTSVHCSSRYLLNTWTRKVRVKGIILLDLCHSYIVQGTEKRTRFIDTLTLPLDQNSQSRGIFLIDLCYMYILQDTEKWNSVHPDTYSASDLELGPKSRQKIVEVYFLPVINYFQIRSISISCFFPHSLTHSVFLSVVGARNSYFRSSYDKYV